MKKEKLLKIGWYISRYTFVFSISCFIFVGIVHKIMEGNVEESLIWTKKILSPLRSICFLSVLISATSFCILEVNSYWNKQKSDNL
jgi:hypothetical protein